MANCDNKIKVRITYAGCEAEESEFDTREEARQYILDVLGPAPTNIHAEILE